MFFQSTLQQTCSGAGLVTFHTTFIFLFLPWPSCSSHHVILQVLSIVLQVKSVIIFSFSLMFLWNIGTQLWDYTILYPKEPLHKISLLWNIQILFSALVTSFNVPVVSQCSWGLLEVLQWCRIMHCLYQNCKHLFLAFWILVKPLHHSNCGWSWNFIYRSRGAKRVASAILKLKQLSTLLLWLKVTLIIIR